jgi:multisubunit Na+/H+ antiporter MnhG subunit
MQTVALRFAESCRRVAVLVASRACPGLGLAEAQDRFTRLPAATQAGLTLSILGWLLAAALVAVQFGLPGLVLYFGGVVLMAR